jgi:ABC-type dipeptide/oligopeptide/nickel transport system permease subunit
LGAISLLSLVHCLSLEAPHTPPTWCDVIFAAITQQICFNNWHCIIAAAAASFIVSLKTALYLNVLRIFY